MTMWAQCRERRRLGSYPCSCCAPDLSDPYSRYGRLNPGLIQLGIVDAIEDVGEGDQRDVQADLDQLPIRIASSLNCLSSHM
jgi:hypothetical protein